MPRGGQPQADLSAGGAQLSLCLSTPLPLPTMDGTSAEVLIDTGAASHRNLAFPALVQVSRPCLLALLAWVVEHGPAQGSSLQLAPCRCPFRLTNSRLEFT